MSIPIISPSELCDLSEGAVEELLTASQDRWSAVTIPVDGNAVIVHNTSHCLERQESNLMHELAHIICGHKPGRVQSAGLLPWASRTYNQDQEDEAKWLGATLQIPREGLVWAVRQRMTNEAIAKHFHASEAIVRFRRNMTGVDTQYERTFK